MLQLSFCRLQVRRLQFFVDSTERAIWARYEWSSYGLAALAERGGEVSGAFMIKGHQKLVKIFNGAIDSSDAVIKEGAKLR